MREEIAVFGDHDTLQGVITYPSPDSPSASLPAIVYLNCKPVHRVGHSRFHVHLARTLAARGHLSLRFDPTDIRHLRALEHCRLQYKDLMAGYAASAMDYLSSTLGVGRFVLFGICAGADLSLDVSLIDHRVVGAILIDENRVCYSRLPLDLARASTNYLLIYSARNAAKRGFVLPCAGSTGFRGTSESLLSCAPPFMDHFLLKRETQSFITNQVSHWLQRIFGESHAGHA